MKQRHEIKSQISQLDYWVLKSRLNAILKRDNHTNQDGYYYIRSLYFDTPGDTALYEKLDGVKVRDKYRIRFYNQDTGFIQLEKKHKNGNLSTKTQVRLSMEQTKDILAGRVEWMINSESELIQEFYRRIKQDALMPKTIVEYKRDPFVFEAGNVRITLDSDIRTGLRSIDFLSDCCVTIPVIDNPIILEVKWDEFLPDIIKNAVQIPNRRTNAFSKYAACRGYDY